MTANSHSNDGGPQQDGPHGREAGKWAVLVDDVVIPVPGRHVRIGLIKELASVPPEFVLVRDHNSPNDVVLDDNEVVDLANGNVFYRIKHCDVTPRGKCVEEAKRAWFLNDAAEITVRPVITGAVLRELFNVSAHTQVFRDVEGTHDVPITADSEVQFSDGPVFIARHVEAELRITVNSRTFTEADGVKKEMTGREIATLVYRDKPDETRVYFVSDGNREVSLTETIKIVSCEVFDVVRKEVTGGFERSRVDHEVSAITASGQRVTVVGEPAAVVYHDLRTRPERGFGTTDVLVPVPSGYPANMLDLAYLPEGSPLLGKVKGQPQDHRITALGITWRQVSYHPHNGGGAPQWDPTQHGFHTYIGEIVSWLHDLQ